MGNAIGGRGLVIIRLGNGETSVGRGSGLGPNVLRPFCHGFGIQKRRDKTFQTFERRPSSNYRIPKGFKTIPKNFQISTRF